MKALKATPYLLIPAIRAIAIVAVAIPSSNAFQAPKAPAVTRFDLNGEWQGRFGVNEPTTKVEKVMIQQSGDDIVAVKITGDEYVPSGKMTIKGTYTGNPFKGEQVCAEPGYRNPVWIKISITVVDATHLKVLNGCGVKEALWERNGQPTLELDSAVLFDLDKYDLKPNSEAGLQKLAAFLNEHHPDSQLSIAGYTDNLGSDAHNLVLSQHRAASVAAWMKNHGFSANRLKIVGYGAANPRYPNTNDEARSRNRRVEIVVNN